MPYSTVTYTADGTETDFLITWNYLDTDHIAVEVGGVDTTDGSSTHTFSLINSTTVRVTDLSSNPITNGVTVKLKRVTPIENRAVTFAEGSALRTTDLNKNSDFLLYSMQEAIDSIDTAATAGAAIASAAAQVAKVGAETAQVNAEAALDELTDLYLGSKVSDPTLDNDGDALQSGALYFNTTASKVKLYNGLIWIDAASAVNGTANRQTYTATASQTIFNITYDVNFVDVYMNGVKLIDGTDFTATNGTSITLTTGADAGDLFDIIAYGAFNLVNHYTKGDADTRFVSLTGTEMTKLATVDANANNYVHPSENHIPTGGTVGQILENSASGTAVWADVTSSSPFPPVPTWASPTFDSGSSGTWAKPAGIGDDDLVVFYVVGSGGTGNTYSVVGRGGDAGAVILSVKGSSVPSTVTYSLGASKTSIGTSNGGFGFTGEDSTMTISGKTLTAYKGLGSNNAVSGGGGDGTLAWSGGDTVDGAITIHDVKGGGSHGGGSAVSGSYGEGSSFVNNSGAGRFRVYY